MSDDENNNKHCAHDGGNCCAKRVKDGQVKKNYCKEVGLGLIAVMSPFCYSAYARCVLFASRLPARNH